MGPNPMTSVPVRRGKFGHRHKRGRMPCDDVMTEAEIGVPYQQAKESQELQELSEAEGEAWSRFSLRSSEGTNPAYPFISDL